MTVCLAASNWVWGSLVSGNPGAISTLESPLESEAIELLEFAFETGIRYFDSAPSYGVAEERLGKFLRSLDRRQRDQLRIATKFGEHWDPAQAQPFVDHSFDALCRSLDVSLHHLGHIDILQLHKTTPDVLRSYATSTTPGLMQRNWEYPVHRCQRQRPGIGCDGHK